MSVAQPLTVHCPTCGRIVEWVVLQRYKPFCSERCKLIDLGQWAAEDHKIPGESVMMDNSETSQYH